jgi:hypothetical protein
MPDFLDRRVLDSQRKTCNGRQVKRQASGGLVSGAVCVVPRDGILDSLPPDPVQRSDTREGVHYAHPEPHVFGVEHRLKTLGIGADLASSQGCVFQLAQAS